jgi:16S rRNA (cytosine1402-N4)-methyltransferase
VVEAPPATFVQSTRNALAASPEESHINPRARSAKLRFGIRTAAQGLLLSPVDFGLPRMERH